MTIAEILAQCDGLTPNRFSTAQKKRWLGDIECQVYQDIIRTHEDSEQVSYTDITADTDDSTELLVPAAYADVYRFYLEAQISLANRESVAYGNAVAAFNSALTNYSNWYNRHHMPLQMATHHIF